MQAILDACDRLRDRLLFAVLYDTGMRIGEALGLRHEDWPPPSGRSTVMPRVNDNGARAKSATAAHDPGQRRAGPALRRLPARRVRRPGLRLRVRQPLGRAARPPVGLPAVYDLVARLRRRTGIDFDPHWYRHTYATRLLRAGTPVEVVSTLLGHASMTTTVDVYGHLSVEDARRALEQAGWFTDRAPRCSCDRAGRRCRRPRGAGRCWAAAGRGPAGVPRRRARVRRRGPGVRRRRLPGRGLRPPAARSQGCARATTCAGVDEGRPDLGRVRARPGSALARDSARTRSVGSPGCRLRRPLAAGCVSCTTSGGTAPGNPTCTRGWPTRRRSRPAIRAVCAVSLLRRCGRRRRCRSATATPTPGRPTGVPRSTCSSRSASPTADDR